MQEAPPQKQQIILIDTTVPIVHWQRRKTEKRRGAATWRSANTTVSAVQWCSGIQLADIIRTPNTLHVVQHLQKLWRPGWNLQTPFTSEWIMPVTCGFMAHPFRLRFATREQPLKGPLLLVINTFKSVILPIWSSNSFNTSFPRKACKWRHFFSLCCVLNVSRKQRDNLTRGAVRRYNKHLRAEPGRHLCKHHHEGGQIACANTSGHSQTELHCRM